MADDDLMPGKGTYKAVYSREPDGAWIVYIRGHRHEIHTFARSLRTARENIRDALSLWYDDADSATIVDRVELEPALEDELAAGGSGASEEGVGDARHCGAAGAVAATGESDCAGDAVG